MKKLMFLLSLTIITITVGYITHAETMITDGLVSYWSFDRNTINGKTVEDEWGKNDATIVGDPKFQSGRVNQGLKLDGISNYVNLTSLGDFGSQMAASTFEAWVKTDHKGGWTTLFKVIDHIREDCVIVWGMDINRKIKPPDPIGGPPIADRVEYWNNYPYEDGRVVIYFGHPTGPNGCSGFAGEFPFQVTDGEWHHLVYIMGAPHQDENGEKWFETALVFDGVWQWKIRTRTLDDEGMIPLTEPVYLGVEKNDKVTKGHFKGMIDEVRIYNRPLTHEEVLQNYEAGLTLSIEPAQKLPTVWGALKSKP